MWRSGLCTIFLHWVCYLITVILHLQCTYAVMHIIILIYCYHIRLIEGTLDCPVISQGVATANRSAHLIWHRFYTRCLSWHNPPIYPGSGPAWAIYASLWPTRTGFHHINLVIFNHIYPLLFNFQNINWWEFTTVLERRFISVLWSSWEEINLVAVAEVHSSSTCW